MRPALVAGALLWLGGCGFPDYGASARYVDGNLLHVAMPSGAQSIQQQFSEDHHLGIDVLGKTGDPVIAAAPGTVVASFREPAYGNHVVIDHGTGPDGQPWRSVYLHLDARLVAVGDVVARGQKIGTLGYTGVLAAGLPHLHFEVHKPKPWGAFRAFDPHLAWADGPGRVTCLTEANRAAPASAGLTYPTPCA